MSEAKEGRHDAISSRLARLNQLLMGKGLPRTGSSVPHKDALLDSFLVLLEECSSDVLVKDNKHVSDFVKKFKDRAKEVRNLRPSLTDFEMKTVIGRGHFGEVQLVRERCTGDMYAMKVLKKSDILSQESVAFFEEERDIMAKATSPWITSLQYAFQDRTSLYLVMDFHPGGDLLNLLSRHDDVFEEKMAQFYLAEMVQAIHCLHLMGYVHRDVKPDNILIDRTGHIKLADFGSAARISKHRTIEARMPVGTPDYIAPEVLTSMNGSRQDYGVGCDWWSLGVVAYEMLFGDTPFSDESVVKTYSNIMNHKVSLNFPAEARVSNEAKELIQCLCCEAKDRLTYEEITCLPFFTGVDWTNLRDSVPPYVPVVGREDDTSNFEQFETELRLPNVELFRSQRGQISGKDLPFIGFTFVKNLSGTQTGHRSTAAVNSPVSHALVEKRLVQKTRELQDLQEKYYQLETKEASLRNTLQKLETRLTEKDSLSSQMEMERDNIEKQMVDYVTEITNLKRCLELERNHLLHTDMKAINLLEEVRQQGKLAQDLQDQEFKAETNALRQTISQLEHDRFVAARRAETLETELRQEQGSLEASKQKVAELQAKVSKLTADSIAKTSELQEKLSEGIREREAYRENKEHEFLARIEFLENKLKMTEAKHSAGKDEAIRLREELRVQTLSIVEKTKLICQMESKLKVLNSQLTEQRKTEDNRQTQVQRVSDLTQEKLYLESQKDLLEEKVGTIKKTETRLRKELGERDSTISHQRDLIGQLESKVKVLESQLKEQQKTVKSKSHEAKSRQQQEDLLVELKEENLYLTAAKVCQEEQLKESKEVEARLRDELNDKDSVICAHLESIGHLHSKMKVLEGEVQDLRKTEEDRNKELRFRHAKEELFADMKQQKLYLETQKGQLEQQLLSYNSTQEKLQEEIRSLEERLTESTDQYEKQLDAVRRELSQARAEVNKDMVKSQTEEHLRTKLHIMEKELALEKKTKEEKLAKLQSEKDDVEDRFNQLRDSCEVVTDLEDQLKQMAEQCAFLECKHTQLEEQVRDMAEDRDTAQAELKQLNNSLTEQKQLCASQKVNIDVLKTTCTTLEEQIEALESLNEELEERDRSWQELKASLQKKALLAETKLQDMEGEFRTEKVARSGAEEKLKQLKEAMETAISCHQQQLQCLQQQLQNSQERGKKSFEDLNESERKLAMIKLTNDGLQRKLAQEKSTNDRITEENMKLQDQVTSLKAINFQLTQGLEAAVERGEHLQTEKADLENQMEAILMTHSHESVKTMSTIAQQTKLIDFLQAKTDGTGKKKKVLGLFHKGKDTPATPAAMPLQYKELQLRLEQEKQHSCGLQQQIGQLKAQLYSTISTQAGTCSQGPMSEAQSSTVLSAIVMSPSQQPSSLKETHNTQTAPESPQCSTRGPKERMHHNIPHRFHTGLNMRGAKCAVCLDTIHFGRQATKCHECKAVCHAKCAVCLPSTCGLPSQFVEHFRMSVRKKKQMSTMNLSADDNSLQMEGWLKVPRNNKMGWDKRWCTLHGSKLLIYDMDNKVDRTLCDEFDLCPEDRTISIHSAVTAAELINTAKTDLPYIIKLESHPCTTCWPGRTLHLMALSFPDKQHWAAALEAAVSTDNMDQDGEVKKLRGNILMKLTGDSRVDINSSLLLNDRTLLLGCEEGLFATTLPIPKKKGLTQIGGVGSVFQMLLLQEIDLMLMIAGPDRFLYHVDLKHLRTKVAQASVSVPTIQTKAVEGLEGCHLFSVGKVDDCVYLCAATLHTLHVLKYNSKTYIFCKKQDIQTSETCSCVQLTSHGFIFGSDKFFHVNPMTGRVTEFLDKTDTSLAFAVFGASQCDSFPVAVLKVSPDDSAEEEYLLCFHEFGVFVDQSGRRSNAEDLKWTRLPLSFAYRQPYLFVTHFNSLEVIEIKQTGVFESAGCRTFIELANPRYIGSALAAGAIYLSCSTDSRTEVLVLQGRQDNTRPADTRGSKKRHHDENTPDDVSSKLARTASWSPSGDICVSGPLRRSARYSNTSSELTASPSSSSSMSSVSAILQSPCNPFTRSTRRRSHAAAKQDT